jgi:hypothetical protein
MYKRSDYAIFYIRKYCRQNLKLISFIQNVYDDDDNDDDDDDDNDDDDVDDNDDDDDNDNNNNTKVNVIKIKISDYFCNITFCVFKFAKKDFCLQNKTRQYTTLNQERQCM